MALAPPANKKAIHSWTLANANDPPVSPLIPAIAQYPVFEAVVVSLRIKDLIPLAQTCQSVYKLLNFKNNKWRSALLSKALCSGKGLRLRQEDQHLCAVRDFHSIIKCRGVDADENIESRPCENCGINTCNECRIHLTYNYLVKDPGLEGRRWWAGHVLLDPSPSAFQPPIGEDDSKWHLPLEEMKPLHDQGLLSVPFGIAAVADPEPLDHLMNITLSRDHIVGSGRLKYPYQMANLTCGLRIVAASRLRTWCEDCVLEAKPRLTPKPCECTLKSRFVDRWECVSCYLEVEAEAQAYGAYFEQMGAICPCGNSCTLEGDDENKNIWFGCAWCNRLVPPRMNEPFKKEAYAADSSGTADDDDIDETTIDGPGSDTEDDGSEYGAGNVFDHEPGCQLPRTWTRKDGTMGLILGHKKILSHCIGHEIYREWDESNNMPELETTSAQENLIIDDMD